MKLKKLKEMPEDMKQEKTTISLKAGDRLEIVKENDEIVLRKIS
jgi:hypothetical protein